MTTPMLHPQGFSVRETQRDDLGNPIEARWLDTQRKPVINQFGYAVVQRQSWTTSAEIVEER